MTDDARERNATQEGPAHITADDLRLLAEAERDEIELALVTDELNRFRDRGLDPSTTASDHVAELVTRHGQLLRDLKWPIQRDRVEPVDRLISVVGHYFGEWSTKRLCRMEEEFNFTPDQGTSGSIEGTRYDGLVEFSGQLLDRAPYPTSLKSWNHWWECEISFPQAPFAGKLYYRFTLEARYSMGPTYVSSGMVKMFSKIGTWADPYNPWETTSLVQEPLTYSPWFTGGNVSRAIFGWLDVKAGATPRLGFIHAVIVSLASGQSSLQGRIGARLTLPDGTPYGDEAFGTIEYRFEPDWLLTAFRDRLEMLRTW
jgi:hypothetical protein